MEVLLQGGGGWGDRKCTRSWEAWPPNPGVGDKGVLPLNPEGAAVTLDTRGSEQTPQRPPGILPCSPHRAESPGPVVVLAEGRGPWGLLERCPWLSPASQGIGVWLRPFPKPQGACPSELPGTREWRAVLSLPKLRWSGWGRNKALAWLPRHRVYPPSHSPLPA